MTSFSLNKEQLNPEQLAAVLHLDGPMLVLAGAGSGKTRVITFRIAHMIASGVPPEQIVAVSFTNKAAAEMRERVAELIGKETARRCQLSTFHSLGANILRKDIGALGYKTPFSILDQGEQRRLLCDVLDEMHLNIKREQQDHVLGIISKAKMAFCCPRQLPGMRFNPWRSRIQKVYERYTKAQMSLNALDFDDLIRLPVLLFREHPEIRDRYRQAWHYIMVDEYQDTNESQSALLDLLSEPRRNLVVVGDDDQSIYGFRGADSEHILSFEKQFPDAKVVTLEQNYRSTQVILEAANSVISNNKVRRSKSLWSSGERGEAIMLVTCRDEREEAAFIADDLERRKAIYGFKFSDIAILYRSHPQSRAFEEVFNSRRIPFKLIGGTKFFDRAEVRDILYYLRISLSPKDEMALRRVINTPPRGIGPATMSIIEARAERLGVSLFAAMKESVDDENIRPLTRSRMGAFIELIERFHRRFMAASEPSSVTARALLKASRYLEHLRNSNTKTSLIQRRVDNVEELINALAHFEITEPERSLHAFLERIALDPPESPKEKYEDTVMMMTLHASKGLEFPLVFMPGCEDGLLPHDRSKNELGGEEEERRLCYVGITRAREQLVLTHCKHRMRFGRPSHRKPSPFLEEIPPESLKRMEEQDESVRAQLASIQKTRDKGHLDALKAAIFGGN